MCASSPAAGVNSAVNNSKAGRPAFANTDFGRRVLHAAAVAELERLTDGRKLTRQQATIYIGLTMARKPRIATTHRMGYYRDVPPGSTWPTPPAVLLTAAEASFQLRDYRPAAIDFAIASGDVERAFGPADVTAEIVEILRLDSAAKRRLDRAFSRLFGHYPSESEQTTLARECRIYEEELELAERRLRRFRQQGLVLKTMAELRPAPHMTRLARLKLEVAVRQARGELLRRV